MDRNNASALPEVFNTFDVELMENEKVLFAEHLVSFETEKGLDLGRNAAFTLTNQRIIVNNGSGIWTVEIEDDIACCRLIKQKLLGFQYNFFYVHLNEEIVFHHGMRKLIAFKFFFKKNETEKFAEIVNTLFH